MLDDIEDSSDLRRSHPATHKVFGIAQTINSGCHEILRAVAEASQLGVTSAVDITLEALNELHVGQSYDLYWTRHNICGLFRLLARLMIAASPRKCDVQLSNSIEALVSLVGVRFQIRDDYQNLQSADYADRKGFYEDLDEGKYSFLLIYALLCESHEQILPEKIAKRRCSLDSANQQLQKRQSLEQNPKEGTAAADPPHTDNFYSPINDSFYDQKPYCSLNKSKRSIRLLQVSRAPVTEERIFTLTKERRLTNARDTYTAISYCAGNPKDTQELRVNSIKFNAFANLARAIDETCYYRETAYNETTYLLWTDQICVNQSDSSERSHQVGMMYDVYENAKEVAGLDTSLIEQVDNIDISIALGDLSVEARTHDIAVASTDPYHQAYTNSPPEIRAACTIIEHIANKVKVNTHDEACLVGFTDFLDSLAAPWWHRAWVAQEFIASRRAVFIVDSDYVSSEEFISAVAAIIIARVTGLEFDFAAGDFSRNAREKWVTFENSTLYPVWETLELIETVSGGAGLHQVLNDCSHRSASDERDRIYAYLDLSDIPYTIVPDYKKSNTIEDVLIQTAREIIQQHNDLEILDWAVPRDAG
ncbi:hypothetical protein E8E11_010966 [Didymella keratinophila]|nr:hypothetical protein E8E11_010966 [Didymella keratinophila]